MWLVPSHRLDHLNRSSKAFRALLVLEPPSPDDEVGLLVWRSIVVRGANIGQMFFSSFGAMRIGSFELCVHSQRALVSNDTQCRQAWRSTAQREHRLSSSTGSA